MWATVEDVLGRWIGDDAPCDAARIQAWIADAETVILAEFPNIQARIDDETLSLDRVRLVVARMVTRAFRNPTGTRQRQETTGPFTGSVTYSGDNPGDLWLTDEERGLLGLSGGSQQAFTVSTLNLPMPGWWAGPDRWLPL
jgi:hypothetical protein